VKIVVCLAHKVHLDRPVKMVYPAPRASPATQEHLASPRLSVCHLLHQRANRAHQGPQVPRDSQEIKDLPVNQATKDPQEKTHNQALLDHKDHLANLDSPGRLVHLETLANQLKAHRPLLENQVHLDKLAHKAHLAQTEAPAQMVNLAAPDQKARLDRTVPQEMQVPTDSQVVKDHLERQENPVFARNIALWMVVSFSKMGFEGKQPL